MTSPINIIRRLIYRGRATSDKEDDLRTAFGAISITGGYSADFVVKRFKSALEASTPNSEAKLAAALDDLNISGGSGDGSMLHRIRYALRHEDQSMLSIALDDLINGGSGGGSNFELREDSSIELREDGSNELRQ